MAIHHSSSVNGNGKSHTPASQENHKPDAINRTTYRRHIERARDGGRWFQFSRDYYLILPKKRLTALFVQDLMNLSNISSVKKQAFDGEEYFLCTSEFLKNSWSMWGDDEQKHHIRILKDKGYIRTRRAGDDGPRWIHIDYEKIENDIDDALGEADPPRKGKIPPTGSGGFPFPVGGIFPVKKESPIGDSNEGKKEEAGNAGRSPNPHLSKPRFSGASLPPITKHEQLAAKLRKALRSNNRQTSNSRSPAKWADALRLLEEIDKQNYEPVLDWFCDHCGVEAAKKFRLPDITSAEQFRARYSWIEGAYRKTLDNGHGVGVRVIRDERGEVEVHRFADGSGFESWKVTVNGKQRTKTGPLREVFR